MTSLSLPAGDSSAAVPLLLSSARLPVWRRVLVLAGLMATAVVWGHEMLTSARDAPLLGVFLAAPIVAAMGLSIVNHPAAQLVCRGVGWFQLLFSTVAAVSSHAWDPVISAWGAGVALLAMGSAGLTEGEATRGSFAPVAFRRSLMVSLVMAIAEIQGLSGVSSIMVHEATTYGTDVNQGYAAALAACAVVLAAGVVGLYRLRVWGLLMHLVAMVGLASLAVTVMPGNLDKVNPLFVWFGTLAVQMLVPLPMLLAIVSRRRVRPPTSSPWPARLFRGLVVAMMAAALVGGLTPRLF